MRSRACRRHMLLRKKKKRNFQFGGALAKKRGPTGVDKAGYIMSMFLSGPKPTFLSAGAKLAGQAWKGVSDNAPAVWDGIRGPV